jgi:hypothetical protein
MHAEKWSLSCCHCCSVGWFSNQQPVASIQNNSLSFLFLKRNQWHNKNGPAALDRHCFFMFMLHGCVRMLSIFSFQKHNIHVLVLNSNYWISLQLARIRRVWQMMRRRAEVCIVNSSHFSDKLPTCQNQNLLWNLHRLYIGQTSPVQSTFQLPQIPHVLLYDTWLISSETTIHNTVVSRSFYHVTGSE